MCQVCKVFFMQCLMKRTPRLPDMKLKVMHSCGQFFNLYDLMLFAECSLTFVVTISARVVQSKEEKNDLIYVLSRMDCSKLYAKSLKRLLLSSKGLISLEWACFCLGCVQDVSCCLVSVWFIVIYCTWVRSTEVVYKVIRPSLRVRYSKKNVPTAGAIGCNHFVTCVICGTDKKRLTLKQMLFTFYCCHMVVDTS